MGLPLTKNHPSLVWADAKLHVIESTGLDGRNRKVLARDVAHPYGVLAFSGHLYWTDWETKAIHRSDTSGQNGQTIRANLAGLMDIHGVNTEYTGINVCGRTNGGCSHLCLRKPHGYSCACPTGILLKSDDRTCYEAPSAFLLFANRGSLRKISLDTADNTDMHLPLNDVYNAVAVDFNYNEWKLYYTDVTLDVIRRVDLNGTNVEVIIDNDLEAADGLALDWIARNIYWADSRRKTIEVARADGSSRKLLINLDLDEPRALALFPEKGTRGADVSFQIPCFQSTYIALSVVGGALVLLLLGALLLWCKKMKSNRSLERVQAPHMARYSNHSPGPADYLDKKPWGWSPKVRYDNHEPALVGIGGKDKLDNLEVAALVSKRLDELESGMITLSSGGGDGKGLYSLGLQGCPTPPSPPRVACPRHSPHSVRSGGSLRRTLPHDMHQQPHHHQHHLPSVETDI
ncbi:hypothetical protein MTO96_025621 [Rhipicephalus appendiculatus]